LTPTILSLCDRTGICSEPFAAAGYRVIRLDLSALLRKDREYFGVAKNYGSAAKELSRSLGFAVPPRAVKVAAKAVCKFWKSDQFSGLRRSARATVFNNRKWSSMDAWVRGHLEEIDATLDTPASIARRMRYSGIITNQIGAFEACLARGIHLQHQVALAQAGAA
jgi:hypothetical protein